MKRQISDWLEIIQSLHSRSIDMGLERVGAVWQRLKLDITCPVITVAGSNGKGSSVAMLDAIYRQGNYRTGAYTSPHLVRYNERICINGAPIDDDTLLRGFEQVEAGRGDTPLTYFEFGTLVALVCFSQAKLDVLLLEVGLGGRLDATNIVHNDVALITSISLDHTHWLGDSYAAIATEKAGVIKPGGKAVYASAKRPKTIDAAARRQGASLYALDRDFKVELAPASGQAEPSEASFTWRLGQHAQLTGLATNLSGSHQVNNAAGVLTAVHLLQNHLPVTAQAIRNGLLSVKVLGRQQWIEGKPSLLLDVSHNADSIDQLLPVLSRHIESKSGQRQDRKVHAVFGVLEDKNVAMAISQLIAHIDAWYLTSIDTDRGQSAAQLLQSLSTVMVGQNASDNDVALFNSPAAAYESAVQCAQPEDIILIFGSFHVVGDIIARLNLV